MAILQAHIELHREVLGLPGMLASPVLTLGYQDIFGQALPKDFAYKDVKTLLKARGVEEVVTTDLFDARADWKHDFNHPVPASEHNRYKTIIDIGTLEHIFDTKQALANCITMLAQGGHYFLVTPVFGYFRHGLHTFNPELIIQAFLLNGFEIRYLQYAHQNGQRVKKNEPASPASNVDIWIVGQKVRSLPDFVNPQQGSWENIYKNLPTQAQDVSRD